MRRVRRGAKAAGRYGHNMASMSQQFSRERRTAMALWALGLLSLAGLSAALGVGAAVLVHPPLFSDLRPWWPPLAAIGLLSTAAGYWLLWGRGR